MWRWDARAKPSCRCSPCQTLTVSTCSLPGTALCRKSTFRRQLGDLLAWSRFSESVLRNERLVWNTGKRRTLGKRWNSDRRAPATTGSTELNYTIRWDPKHRVDPVLPRVCRKVLPRESGSAVQLLRFGLPHIELAIVSDRLNVQTAGGRGPMHRGTKVRQTDSTHIGKRNLKGRTRFQRC